MVAKTATPKRERIGEPMSQPDIVFARIDNRLVHGQVGASWVGAVNANLVVVADDVAAKDQMAQTLMRMTADAAGVGIRFFSIQKTIDVIGRASESQHIFIVAKTPASMRALVDGGVPIKEVNIGNMHNSEGKHVFHDQHVYVDDKDLKDLSAIASKGVHVYIQIAPTYRKIENLDLLA
jgi:PTS system galactosamine-specific IIB component